MAAQTPIISTHLSPAKDRSLAIALIRMSEKRSLLDDFVIEKVVYCGKNEPFKGWTNTAPIARYYEGNRPDDDGMESTRKKKTARKSKQIEPRDSLSDVYSELMGMTTRADGHYHASITIQELYDEYKKKQSIEDHSKFGKMVDPVTFRYIPIDERSDSEYSDNYTNGQLKLPVLKMTHASKQAKLLEVLESFMARKPGDHNIGEERYAVKARDAASFYDKYRWYFKDKQSRLSHNIKTKRHGKRTHKKRSVLGGKDYISESDSDISKIRSKKLNPSYVIHVKDDKSNTTTQETITFERKTDYNLGAPGGPGIDRWVAHVSIRDSTAVNNSATPTTTSEFTEKSSQDQNSKLQDERANRQTGKTQDENTSDYRLSKRSNRKRNGRKLPPSFYELINLSLAETAKVTVKYNVQLNKKLSSLPKLEKNTTEKHQTLTTKEHQNARKNKTSKPTPVHSQKYIASDDELKLDTEQVIPLSKNAGVLDTISDENEDTQSQYSPLPRIIAKQPALNVKNSVAKQSKKKKKVKISTEKTLLSTPRTFESSEEQRIKTPSSSTFNPDRMFQQMKDTAEFITKASTLTKNNKSINSSPRFLSNIEDARESKTNQLSITNSDANSRKPLHPRHNKNRAQDRIQQMIDEEKALISGVIKQLNSNIQHENAQKYELESVPDNIQDALSTAIAKARLSEMQISGLSSKTGSQKSSMNHVMKRRGVPPLKDKSAVSTTTVGSKDNFFISDSIKHIPVKPSIATLKPSQTHKKSDNKRITLSNDVRSLSKDRNETLKRNKLQPGIRFVADGDFLITKPHPFAPSIPGNFAASISSIKPVRRIANVNQAFDIRQRA